MHVFYLAGVNCANAEISIISVSEVDTRWQLYKFTIGTSQINVTNDLANFLSNFPVFENVKVVFIRQLIHQWAVLKNDIKIKTAPTFFRCYS